VCAILLAGLAVTARAADAQRGSALIVTEENDAFASLFGKDNQDRHYTQGLKFTYIADEKDFTWLSSRFTRWTPKFGLKNESSNVGFTFGQNVYTPLDKTSIAPVPNDRPYAGWLYGGVVFQRRGTTFNNIETLDNYELDLGVVGPASLAAESQRQWHRWTQVNLPAGWENQLKNEPGFELKYARYWRLTPNEKVGRYFDFIPHVGCSLGNINTLANMGVLFRLGYNLPQDFGPANNDGTAPTIAARRNDKTDWLSVYVYGGGEGRVVGHSIFLDGNTFADSQSVHKSNPVGDIVFGFGIAAWQHVELNFTGVMRSNQFSTQPGGTDCFGSITLKAIFGI